jgi:hypothetical protein
MTTAVSACNKAYQANLKGVAASNMATSAMTTAVTACNLANRWLMNATTGNLTCVGPSNFGVKQINPVYALDVLGDINCSGALRVAGASVQADMIGLNTSITALSNTIMNKSSGYLASAWYPFIGTDPYVSTPLFKTIFNYVGAIGKVWSYMSPEMVTGMGSNAWGMTVGGYYQNPMSGTYKISLNMWMPDAASSNSGFQLWKRTYGVGASNSFVLPPIIGTPGKILSFSIICPILFGEIIGVSPYNILNLSIPMYLESIEYIAPI